MRYLLIIIGFVLVSCGASKIRYVRVAKHKSEKVDSFQRETTFEIEIIEAKRIDTELNHSVVNEAADEEEPISSQDDFVEKESNIVAKNEVLYSEEARCTEHQQKRSDIPLKEQKEVNPEESITLGNLLLILSLLLLVTSFALLVITLTKGVGLPFIYIFLASVVFYTIGTIKAKQGYKNIALHPGSKEELFKLYRKGKIIRRILELLFMLWICIFLFILVFPFLNAGGQFLAFIFSGGINLSGMSFSGFSIVG